MDLGDNQLSVGQIFTERRLYDPFQTETGTTYISPQMPKTSISELLVEHFGKIINAYQLVLSMNILLILKYYYKMHNICYLHCLLLIKKNTFMLLPPYLT